MKYRYTLACLLTLACMFLSPLINNDSTAQTGCPAWEGDPLSHWASGKTVLIITDGVNPDDPVRPAIVNAANQYINANNANGTQVGYTTSVNNETGTYPRITVRYGAVTGGNAVVSAVTDRVINPDGSLASATIILDPNKTYFDTNSQTNKPVLSFPGNILKALLHEFGHLQGLQHHPGTPCSQTTPSVMNAYCINNGQIANIPSTLTDCDKAQMKAVIPPPTPSPTPTPEDPCANQFNANEGEFTVSSSNDPCGGEGEGIEEEGSARCNDGADNDNDGLVDCDEGSCVAYCPGGCSQYQQELCIAIGAMGCWQGMCYTPAVVDVGEGIEMTSAERGPTVKINNRVKAQMAFPIKGMWLFFDRNGNGQFDDCTELFGTSTEQPDPDLGETRNAFRALAEIDSPRYKGNGDGIVDKRDPYFARLQLWQDKDLSGTSEPSEFHSLGQYDILAFELNYHESKYVDEYGNLFQFWAKLQTSKSTKKLVGKKVQDVVVKTKNMSWIF